MWNKLSELKILPIFQRFTNSLKSGIKKFGVWCIIYLFKPLIIIFAIILLLALQNSINKLSILIMNDNVDKVKIDEEKFEVVDTKLKNDILKLDKKLSQKIPKSYYLVINSAINEFSLYKGDVLIKHDKCSTGSYVLLKNGSEQQWMFKTPKGEFRILGKRESPVWKKPDWAFIEEGLPVPSANHFSRFEYGVLGDYALSLGDGYLIHGTLYQRFLGLPVTHGCIRLNDENLKLVYNSLQIGSKVYIY